MRACAVLLGVLVSLLLTAPASAVYDIDSSHVPMLSHPDLVLDVIRTAANAVQGSAGAAAL
jgi:hypothetical protein